MGKTNDYYQDLMTVCVMPNDTFEELKNFDGVYKISVYDNNMRKHYKVNEQWQEAHHQYELAMDKKKLIEANIDFKMLQNK